MCVLVVVVVGWDGEWGGKPRAQTDRSLRSRERDKKNSNYVSSRYDPDPNTHITT